MKKVVSFFKKLGIDISEGKYFKIFSIILGLVMGLVMLCWISIPTEDSSISYTNSNDIKLNWLDAEGRDVAHSTIKIKPGEKYSIFLKFDSELYPNVAIGYYDPGFNVAASLDDQVFYEDGGNNQTFGKELGGVWKSIPLDTECGDKTLKLTFANQMYYSQKIDISSISIGQSNDTIAKLIATSTTGAIEFVVCFCLTCILIFFAIFLYKTGYKKYGRILAYLGMLSLSMGCWVLFDGNLCQLFCKNASIRYGLSYMFFFMIPFWLALYYKENFEKNEKIFNVFLIVYETSVLLCLVLCLLNICHITKGFLLVYACLWVEIGLVGKTGIQDYIFEKSNRRKGTIINFILLLATLSVGVYEFALGKKSWIATITGFCFLLLLMVSTKTELAYIFRHYRDAQKIRNFKEISKVDAVTGGNSRAVANDWLSGQDLKFYDNVWMIHMNLIDYRAVNTMIGWNNGDRILREVYHVCQERLHKDDLICSIGDSNFVFLICNIFDIDAFCKDITESLGSYFSQNWDDLVVNACYTAVEVHQGETIERLLDAVRLTSQNPLAGYNEEAKCYYYNSKCRAQTRLRLEFESGMESAIRNGEFKMYLQPKVSPKDNSLGGAEALVRWKSKEGNIISPEEFVPILENSGQIRMVDLYMFKRLCQYLIYRRNNGLKPIVISVNISKTGINREQFFDDYERIIEELKVPAECLEFELTESVAFDDMGAVERLINRIHRLGAKVAMDDFGSGFSNIGIIGQLNFDVVKLDKLFFESGFPANRQNYTLVRGIINVFHEMNINVVCEGVENDAQKNALADLGADLIQGYYYSRPLEETKFTEWVTNYKISKDAV